MLYKRVLKSAMDRMWAAIGLAILSPVLALLAVAVRVRLGSPVLFRQRRIGLRERPFVFLKFRTMTNATDASGRLLPDAARLTPFGRFLRDTSLDELPQLWNVLLGDMSLVGPRPLLSEYLTRYSPFQRRRHEARPGITGWAQVNGRNSLTWEQKFELDVWYVDHITFQTDAGIVWKTLVRVLKRSGINSSDHATMTEFRPAERAESPEAQ